MRRFLSLRATILVVSALALAALGGGALAARSTPATAAPPPRLVEAGATIRLGDERVVRLSVPARPDRDGVPTGSATYRLSNVTVDELQIEEIRSTCVCVRATPSGRAVPSGASLDLVVTCALAPGKASASPALILRYGRDPTRVRTLVLLVDARSEG